MAEPLDLLRASLASRYTVEEEIGRGGMAFVYRARDRKHNRNVAIKVLRPELAAVLGPDRFAREIQLTATLNHPRILAIHDSGTAGGLLYYVMPFVHGESLRTRLERERQLPVEDAIVITTAIASALSYAHELRVVHRDVKPENVMLANGEVIVADFGIGRALETTSAEQLTESGLALGTPEYMSPEQASADPHVDGRSDQFSLGCVLFEMLVGEPPFRGPTMQAIIARRMTEPMPSICTVRGGVPVALETVVRKSLEKAPADRFTTMAAFAEALTKTRHEAEPRAIRFAATRNARRLAAGILLAVGLLVASWLVIHRPAANRGVAVLDFRSASGDSTYAAFGVGLADQLSGALGQAAGLRVIPPRGSSDAQLAMNVSEREIGARLGATMVLSGTVEHFGNEVRVLVRLTSTSDGSLIWHNDYTKPASNIFVLQDSIAGQIESALHGVLLPGAPGRTVRYRSVNAAAQESYSLARFQLQHRSPDNLREALRNFEATVSVDSTVAGAFAGLSTAYTLNALWGLISPRDGWPLARTAAARAVQLDSSSAEAHISLALYQQYHEYGNVAARREFDKAIGIDPDNPDAHLFLALFLQEWGDPAAASREARLAVHLDTLSAIIATRLGTVLYELRDYDGAIGAVRYALTLDPNFAIAHIQLAQIYVAQGRCAEALAQLDAVRNEVTVVEGGIRGFAYARCGRVPEARRMLADLTERSKKGFVFASRIGWIYLGLNERDSALAWIDKGTYEFAPLELNAPIYDSVRSDPRFKQILARIRGL